MGRRVCYVHSAELQRASDALPSNLGRASLVHSLISSYGLLDDLEDAQREEPVDRGETARASCIEPVEATRQDLLSFHDEEFIDSLLGTESVATSSVSESDSDVDSDSGSASPRKRQKTSHYSSSTTLVDDCPPFSALPRYVQLVAGASLTAARQLRDGLADVAISWNGGRHHASRGEAKGFCYVNDIVLAIMELRKPPVPRRAPCPPRPPSGSDSDFDSSPNEEEEVAASSSSLPLSTPKKLSKILYLDLDLHHGDAVESAFVSSPYILTLSLHLHAPLFYPSTGSLDSCGPLNPRAAGRGHALNLALESGLGGQSLQRVWEIVEKTKESFSPDAIVVQCGVDGLNGDPCKEWNLCLEDFGTCIRSVLAWNLPTLLLGGGGYSSPNAARTWTYLTSICLDRSLALNAEIPSSLASEDYEQFGPSFTLDVEANETTRDRNNDSTLSKVERVFERHCDVLRQRWGTSSMKTDRSAHKLKGANCDANVHGIPRAANNDKKNKKRVRFKLDGEEEGEEVAIAHT